MADAKARHLATETIRKYQNLLERRFVGWCETKGFRLLKQIDVGATRPSVVILAGPNGAGKSTVASALLLEALAVDEFVNADVIARGLSGFEPDRVAISAGRIMLARLKELAARRADFAFETTLATRSFAPWLRDLRLAGYDMHFFFLWLASADLAIARVADRVGMGGHYVADEVVRRRYSAGIRNFFRLYRPLATTWTVYNNSGPEPVCVAEGLSSETIGVYDKDVWETIKRQGTI